LRKVLGDDGHQFIETVPRRGFRFVAPVTLVVERETEQVAPSGWRKATIGLAVIVALAGFAAIGWKSWAHFHPAPQNLTSIAVLPFHPIGNDEDQYLGVAMADALNARLGNVRGLLVRPTSAVRKFAAPAEPLAAGRELNVDFVVDGTIERAGDRIRVTVQLVDISRDTPRWSDTFNIAVSDVFSLQARISERVTGALFVNRNGHPPRYTENADAHSDYLRGRYFWNKRTADAYMRAIENFQSAIRKDPSYALAYAGLADSYALLGSMTNRYMPRHEALPKALSAVHRALEIDDSLAEAHTSLGFIKMHYQWDWKRGEREFRRAIQLNPGYATAHHWFAYELVALSRFDEAIREIREAQKADPVSVIINTDIAEILFFARRYDEAIAQCRLTIDLDPNFALVYWVLARSYRMKGQYPEAIVAALKAAELDPDRPDLLIEIATGYRNAGRPAEAKKAIDEWKRRTAKSYDSFFTRLNEAVLTGNRDQAFASLERHYAEHSGSIILLNVEPDYANLRGDQRFKSLVQRLHLDDAPHRVELR
jgi:TolB-like protein/Tfp pilus assembly protein PilF